MKVVYLLTEVIFFIFCKRPMISQHIWPSPYMVFVINHVELLYNRICSLILTQDILWCEAVTGRVMCDSE